MRHLRIRFLPRAAVGLALIATLFTAATVAQDRLKTMPGYAQYERMSREIPSAVSRVRWRSPGRIRRTLEYMREAKRYRYDLATKSATEADRDRDGGQLSPGRTREARRRADDSSTRRTSPDGKLKAFYRDRNLWLERCRRQRATRRSRPTAARRRGSNTARRAGSTAKSCSQTHRDVVVARQHAGSRYYRFDEQQVPDYYLQLDQTQAAKHGRRRGVSEGRRAESDRRSVRLRRRDEEDDAHRRARRQAVRQRRRRPLRLPRRRGRPTARELLFNRTNRRQNIMEFAAADPATGTTPRHRCARSGRPAGSRTTRAMHVPEGWQALHLGVGAQRLEELLPLRSERARSIAPLTTHSTSRSAAIVKIDEAAGADLLHGARRRQPHEAAAAPGRPRWQGTTCG